MNVLYSVARLNVNSDRLNLNCNRNPSNTNDSLGMALVRGFNMKTYKNLYAKLYNMSNLILAWRKARKGKTKKSYVIEFEKDIIKNLFELHNELKNQTYKPIPLKTFILRDPKTRKISKSAFRDMIVHHALVRILQPIFDKIFICDSCANRLEKGTTYALKRLDYFKRRVSRNNTRTTYCLKADVKHYFQEVNHNILLSIISKKIKDKDLIWCIKQILGNNVPGNKIGKGMPLGNLTSQFFANIYLNKLDYFIKYKLKIKYYLRYVDDFILLHSSKLQLKIFMISIDLFLKQILKLELHPDKSKIINLSNGIDFIGFRNFYHYRLLRKRNIINIRTKIRKFSNKIITYQEMKEIYGGWQAYSRWANSYKLRKIIVNNINKSK